MHSSLTAGATSVGKSLLRSLVATGLFAISLGAFAATFELVAGPESADAIGSTTLPPLKSTSAVSTIGGSWSYGFNRISEFSTVIATADGGFMAAGNTHYNVNAQTSDLLLMRLDGSGNKIWTKILNYQAGTYHAVWQGHNLVATSDGAYILSAYADTFGSVPQIIKFDDTGKLLWSKSYGAADPNFRLAWISSTAATEDGGAILLGGIKAGTNFSHVALLRINAAGEPVWYTYIGSNAVHHYPWSLKRASDGNFIGSGEVLSLQGVHFGWAFKINSLGTLLWSSRVAAPIPNSYFLAKDITETTDGNYLLTGFTTSQPGASGYVAKLNSSGALLWQNLYSNAGVVLQPLSIAATNDGGAVIVGASDTPTDANGFAARISSAGDVVWSSKYTTGAQYYSIVQAPGGYAISGQLKVVSGANAALLTRIDDQGVTAPTCAVGSSLPLTRVAFSDIAPADDSSTGTSSVVTTITSPAVFSENPFFTSFCSVTAYLLTVVKAGHGSGTVTSDTGIISCGATCSDNYAAGTAVTLTATPAAGSRFTGWLGAAATGGPFATWQGACTGTGTCQSGMSGQTAALATFALTDIGVPSLDVDGSTHSDALTDGLLIVRSLFGLSGASLVNGAIGQGATRTSAVQVSDYLTDTRPILDVDGNGTTDALTDGLLIIRYLFGLRGNSLINGAVSAGATRTNTAAIETYLQGLSRP